MSYAYIGQMFDHVLNVLKGWPQMYALDIEGTLGAAVNINSTNVPPCSGLCVHVQSVIARTANGVATGPAKPVFEMGANVNMMPLFLWPSWGDFDVNNPGVPAGTALGGTTTTLPAWIPIQPSGNLVALVAKGPYELETTEFDTAQTYAPNDLLRAVTSNTDVNAGKLTNQNAAGGAAFVTSSKLTVYTDSVVGRVSRGAYTNALGKSVLAFWPESIIGSR
jgi:hypothetical protein